MRPSAADPGDVIRGATRLRQRLAAQFCQAAVCGSADRARVHAPGDHTCGDRAGQSVSLFAAIGRALEWQDRAVARRAAVRCVRADLMVKILPCTAWSCTGQTWTRRIR